MTSEGRFVSVLFLLVVCWLPVAAFAEVTGSMRAEFINGFERSCFETQRNYSLSNGISSDTLKKYCRCSAIYLADSLNNELVKSIVAGENRLNPNLVNLAAAYCQKQISRS